MSNNIIINFPTNFGDTVLALPILDRIRADYPEDTITVFASPRTKSFLMQNSFIDEVILFDKSWTLWQKIRFALNLRGKYDMIFDFKNSFLPVALGIKKHTPFFRGAVKKLHIKDSYFIISQKLFKKNS